MIINFNQIDAFNFKIFLVGENNKVEISMEAHNLFINLGLFDFSEYQVQYALNHEYFYEQVWLEIRKGSCKLTSTSNKVRSALKKVIKELNLELFNR